MKKIIICGIGNALVDSEYKVSDSELLELKLTKGCMELNDKDNHVKLSKQLKDSHGVVKMMPGGSVANSLYTLSQFGIKASFIGKVSDDYTGKSFVKSLQDIGIETSLQSTKTGITGECLVLITPDHERTMYTYLGVSSDLRRDDINSEDIKNSEYLLIEGYLVTSEYTKAVASHCLDIATENNIKKIITLSDPNVINFFRDNMMELLEKNLDIIFCNKQEALNISMKDNTNDAINFLKQYSSEIIVTSGSDGAYAYANGELVHVKSENIKPVDLTGAGDMFLAAYMYSKLNNQDPTRSIMFANKCSAEIIQKYGAKFDDQMLYKQLLRKL